MKNGNDWRAFVDDDLFGLAGARAFDLSNDASVIVGGVLSPAMHPTVWIDGVPTQVSSEGGTREIFAQPHSMHPPNSLMYI